MTQRLFAACGLAVLLAAAPALAQGAPPPPDQSAPPPEGMGPPPGDMPPPPRDDRGDDRGPHHPPRPLTRAEAQAMVARGFAMLDTNRDGAIGRDEYEAFRRARHEEMMARRAGRGDANAPPRSGDDRPDMPPPGGPGVRDHGPGPMMSGPRWFELADANHDGRVTPAEAQAAAMALFDRMDTNHDGVVDPEERRAAMAMMRPHGPPPAHDDMPPPARPQ